VKILKIRQEILMAIVAVLVVIGSYSMKTSIFDVQVMLLFGVIGYCCDKLGYNAAPIVIGIILGSLVDFNLRRTLIINAGSIVGFFNRPLSVALICLILLSAAGPVLKKIRKPKVEL